MSVFEALNPGRCDACGDSFEAGDEIGFASGYDRAVCGPCVVGLPGVQGYPTERPCPDCWLVHKGECV